RYNLARRRQYQYDARRQQGDGGGVFGDSQFTSTLSVNFHFPKIPRRTIFLADARHMAPAKPCLDGPCALDSAKLYTIYNFATCP
ncbi:hypothetical protein, partial [Aeromonas caviae]|uniref:hypothetical protein n=1 Tax=Aeromonas caviae TaxID=648 RepID=UPI001C1F20A4